MAMSNFCEIPGASLAVARDAFPDATFDPPPRAGERESLAVLAGGCFWCTEAVFRELDGVLEVCPGYSGGDATRANYTAVCGGDTGHAEALRIRFDPTRISFARLLKVFFAVAHDPTQKDRQGNDVGSQYRSAIFYADDDQLEVAERYIRQLEDAGVFNAPIVTELVPLDTFHVAEKYHHDYAAQNPDQPYIAAVAAPKVGKLREKFGDLLKGGGESR
jgi:peptide-methionine (S)-S-oxide reductase